MTARILYNSLINKQVSYQRPPPEVAESMSSACLPLYSSSEPLLRHLNPLLYSLVSRNATLPHIPIDTSILSSAQVNTYTCVAALYYNGTYK